MRRETARWSRTTAGPEVGIGEREAGEAEVGVGLVELEAVAGGEGEGFVEVLAGEVEGPCVCRGPPGRAG